MLLAPLIAGLLGLLAAQPPPPRPADAPPSQLSAERVRDRLIDLLGPESPPHPVGSPANDRVRERLIAQLRALGLEPTRQRAFICAEQGNCAWVENLIVRIEGASDRGAQRPAVALLAHYDSVGAGPGAADDGHGVALLLEVLRIVAPHAPHARPLLAIFTDGEELALLGARALFVEGGERPITKDELGVVLNVEARGTTGVSRMFESSRGAAPLIAAFAAGATRPSATSLAVEIFRKMPNDTDLSVFLDNGVPGLNFGFIGGVARYHTPRDDLAHLDLRSVQQQGDALLGAALALLAADTSLAPAGDAAYTDLGGRLLLRWPAPLCPLLAAAALLALLFAARRVSARSDMSLKTCLMSLFINLLVLLAGVLGGVAAERALNALRGAADPFPNAFLAAALTLALGASLCALLLLCPLVRRVGAPAQAIGAWTLWGLLTLALALAAPAASAPWLPPLLLAALLLLLFLPTRHRPLALTTAACFAFFLWIPLLAAFNEALGVSGPLIGGLVAFLLLPLSPALAGLPRARRLYGALLALLLLSGAAVLTAPTHAVDHPAKANFLQVTDLDAGTTHLHLDAPAGVPEPLRAHPWGAAPELPWTRRQAPAIVVSPTKGAADAPQPHPTLRVDHVQQRPGGRTLTATYLPRPGALLAHLVLPPEVTALTLEDFPLSPGQLRRGPGESRVVTIFGPPAAGIALSATMSGSAPWVLVDAAPGRPAAADQLAITRPLTVVPYQWGDQTIVYRAVTLP
jgi:hypothetical protein